MSDVEREIERVQNFVEKYHILGQGHMVSFFTDDYFDHIVLPEAKIQERFFEAKNREISDFGLFRYISAISVVKCLPMIISLTVLERR